MSTRSRRAQRKHAADADRANLAAWAVTLLLIAAIVLMLSTPLLQPPLASPFTQAPDEPFSGQ